MFNFEGLVSHTDYTEEQLNTPIGDYLGLEKCPICYSTGSVAVQNGEDDVNMDICDNCSGAGYFYEDSENWIDRHFDFKKMIGAYK